MNGTINGATNASQSEHFIKDFVIAELERTIVASSEKRCGDMMMHITDLFLSRSARSDIEMDLFDDIMSRLISALDASAKSMLSRRLASIAKAPNNVMRLLAHDDDIQVAGPLLASEKWVDEDCLLQIATSKGQDHLSVIAKRKPLPEAVSGALVERGNGNVLLLLVENSKAALSETALTKLVDRCWDNDSLAACLGSRPDIPHHLLQKLLEISSEPVRTKFFEMSLPVRLEFSAVEPQFVFVSSQSLVAA
jgi:uncharacterized protein (DUF2336 family)